jgi:AbrB family looped-hinge helix DNA binding protein
MPTATLTSKGQITVPKEVREALGVKTGDRLGFRIKPDGTIVVLAETVDLSELRGSVKPRVRGVSVEDMQAAVHKAVAKRARSKSRK